MSAIEIKNEFLTVLINTHGAEITSVKDQNGAQYIWQKDPSVWGYQCPVLFPIVSGFKLNGANKYFFCNKEYEMKQHGFARLLDFKVEKKALNSAVFLLMPNDFTRIQYPFDFEFRVRYTLCEKTLKIEYITDNKGESPLYYSTGSHEALAIKGSVDNYSVIFDEDENLCGFVPEKDGSSSMKKFLSGEKELKLSEKMFEIDSILFLDFKSKGVSLRDDRSGEKIHVSFPCADTLLLWKKPQGEFICIEPWSGAPDLPIHPYRDLSEKFRIRTLSPGEREIITHSFEF